MQDILIRTKRMQGYAALWVPGTDHASIATEAKVVDVYKRQKARCQAGFCVCWGFFLFEKSSGRQCIRPIEQLLSAATPPAKMQARKVRRLSGLVLSQNIILLMIAGA